MDKNALPDRVFAKAEDLAHLLLLNEMGLSPAVEFTDQIAELTNHYLHKQMKGRLTGIRVTSDVVTYYFDLSEFQFANEAMPPALKKDSRILKGVVGVLVPSGADAPFKLVGFYDVGSGQKITQPFVDETTIHAVDPVEYYGEPFIRAFKAPRRVFQFSQG